MEKISYKGWPNCCRLSTGVVDLIVTGDVGPRVIRFGFVGQDNEFKEYPDMVGQTGGDEWRIYGGHRFWHSPEAMPRTYFPDNGPVKVEDRGPFVRVTQPTEPANGIAKEIDLRPTAGQPHVQVTHRMRNESAWPIELAPWALTVMATGGSAIVPLPLRGTHEGCLMPTSLLSLWAYTDLADPRWTFGRKYILLRQDPAAKAPQKAGLAAAPGWIAYARNNHLFVKRFALAPGGIPRYPDFGCCVEFFSNADMLEVETLGPLTTLAPGATVEHVEDWFLYDGVPTPKNDADVDRDVVARL